MTEPRTSTFIGPRPEPRVPAPAAQPRKLRDWPRDRLVQLLAESADRARELGAEKLTFVLDIGLDALVALEAADNRARKAEHDRDVADASARLLEQALLAERAKVGALLAQIGGDRFDEETVNRESPLLGQERTTSVVEVPGAAESAQPR